MPQDSAPDNAAPPPAPASLRRETLCVFAILFVIGLLLLRPSIHGHDGMLNFVYLQSYATDRDLHFEDEYAYFDGITHNAYALGQTPQHPATLKPMNFYGVGSALLWSPFYFGGYALRAIFTADPPLFQSARFDAWTIGLGTLFWATLGLALLYHLARLYHSRSAALLGLLLLLGCSPLPFYIYFHPSMSHGCSFFAVALCIMLYLHPAPATETRRWIMLGCGLALLLMIRIQDGALILALAVSEAAVLKKRFDTRERALVADTLANYAACFAALLLLFLPQFFAWNTLHGSPFSGPAHYLAIDALDLRKPVHFLQILGSSRHGLFFWHPLLLLGLLGLLLQPKIIRMNRGAWLAALLAHAWIIACWRLWWAGASFGHRMFIAILPLLFLGAVNLFDRRPAWRKGFAVLLIAGALWNAGLIVQYAAEMIPREDYVSFRKILDNQFRAAPRFLIDRGTELFLRKSAQPPKSP